ncbi:hypothetical protein ACGFIK_24670 [Micromonospora sp. NPDC048871]|uniref:hypothetical protein n=1 Tax=unclassified Micromonospora TaxID=2617518 RepID=UPI002E128C96|nr:hypothetical protein OIE53_00425 [Micromonospora sp. NBC_01739]
MPEGNRLRDSLPSGARRKPLYRLTVWWLRLLPIALVLSMAFLVDGGWVVMLVFISAGLLITLPMRYIAYAEWEIKQSDFDELALRDAINPRFW